MLDELSYIAEKLNEKGVVWSVGASVLLTLHGITDKPNDIDLLVDLHDIETADKILSRIGEKKKREKSATYSTKYFYEYVIRNYEVDVMSGLIINHKDGEFEYNFDLSSISMFEKINGIRIPLSSLEDWYVIYQLISGRASKVRMIEEYLLTNGVTNPHLLKKSLASDLPDRVREKIRFMLEYQI